MRLTFRGWVAVVALAVLTVLTRGAGGEMVASGEAPLVETQKTSTSQSITSQVFERLPGGRNFRDVLLLVPGMVDGKPVDAVSVDLEPKVTKAAEPGFLQPHWKWIQTPKGLKLVGPPAGGPGMISAGFGVPLKFQLPKNLKLTLYGDQKVLASPYVPILPLNPPQLIVDPSRAVRIPQSMTPGGKIWFAPLDKKFTPGGGTWKVDGLTPQWNGSYDRPIYKFDLPKDFKLSPQQSLRISYTDPWGETLVDGPVNDVKVEPQAPPSDRPLVSGWTPMVEKGHPLTLCGNFTPESADDLRVNDQSIEPFVLASSERTLVLSTDFFELGELVVSAREGSGIAIADSAPAVLIAVSGAMDSAKLMRGESTAIELIVDGSLRPVVLKVENTTPGIVSIKGGNDQIVMTSGGGTNKATRWVNALRPGKFDINFRLALGSGPCTSDSSSTADDCCAHQGGPVTCPPGLPPGSSSVQFVPGGTQWMTPAGASVFVPATTFVYCAPAPATPVAKAPQSEQTPGKKAPGATFPETVAKVADGGGAIDTPRETGNASSDEIIVPTIDLVEDLGGAPPGTSPPKTPVYSEREYGQD